jgi:hypothetical protein
MLNSPRVTLPPSMAGACLLEIRATDVSGWLVAIHGPQYGFWGLGVATHGYDTTSTNYGKRVGRWENAITHAR